MESSDHYRGSGESCSPAPASVRRGFSLSASLKQGFKEQLCNNIFSLICQITVIGELPTSDKKSAVAQLLLTLSSVFMHMLYSCPYGELHWSIGIMQFSEKK